MTDRDRAWDAEHHRAALQIITEADRGLKVAEHQLKAGRLMDARETVRIVRGLLPPLERAIQRRPVRAEETPMGDLTPEKLAELRRLAATAADATTERTPWYSADDLLTYGVESEDDAPYFAALTPPTVLELLDAATERDRLAEAVRAYGRTIDRWGLLIIAATRSEDITTSGGDGDWEVIESRLAEVPALLTERDALAAKLANMTEARDSARAEVERLTALLERVRALHFENPFQSGACNECDAWHPCDTLLTLDGEADRD